MSRSTRTTQISANGAEKATNSPSKSGNGSLRKRSGTNTMIIHGTTGDHQRMDSPKKDGNGTPATGTMMAMPTSTRMDTGTDSKTENGLNTAKPSQLLPSHHVEVRRFAVHTTR